MSSAYSPQHYYTAATGALPIPPSSKAPHHHQGYPNYYYPSGGESTYSVSPPEGVEILEDEDVSSASGYANSYSVPPTTASGSSYYHAAGSSHGVGVGVGGGCDYDSAGSAGGIDLNEYMQERFAATFDPLALDKCTVKQAQTSGHLNAKHRELLELQAKAQARLAKTRARFAQGLEDAREVRNDLEWTQKKVASLKTKASKKHSKEYAKARARYPSPDLY
ncbi:hypothetical protein C8A01DRAFT_33893 [Parachaetomium inaequale]|uniref:Biogenesis of lysosome-related organelles complex 1 subunit KXD1 n=1 Tax=Parachaetomium inaequale TaxID=2588326 RepID=A0AAN6PJ89_9PEZI|nr:hypothetical protein C8A01DRAFT_33893 [Parachaetomium inaequale]